MYTSFHIENFRTFKTLTLPECRRINIITGKNNSGKTALLEAMFLHIGAMNPQCTLTITGFRGVTGFVPDPLSLWGPLFNHYNSDKPIKLVAKYDDGSQSTLTISLVPSTSVTLDKIELEEIEHDKLVRQPSLIPMKYLQYDYHHKKTSVTRITEITQKGFNINPPVTPNPFDGFFIPARHELEPGQYANRFGALQTKKLDKIIVRALQILEPGLKSLSVIPIGPVPIIHVDTGGDILMPIYLAGEGMTRISRMCIDIASAPDGIVLIDDIDTGIHHSVLSSFWKVLFRITKNFNTQIFVTTHSAECLEAAHVSLSRTEQKAMKVHRLQRIGDSISVISYDNKKLGTAIETGLEIR